MIRRHFIKNMNFITYLTSIGRSDEVILSLIVSETFFRSMIHRMCELAYWIFLCLFDIKKVENLSIGYSQVQVKYWLRYGYFMSAKPSLKNMKMAMDIKFNYDIVNDYLNEYLMGETTTAIIAKVYRGATGRYHCEVLGELRNEIHKYLNSNKYLTRQKR